MKRLAFAADAVTLWRLKRLSDLSWRVLASSGDTVGEVVGVAKPSAARAVRGSRGRARRCECTASTRPACGRKSADRSPTSNERDELPAPHFGVPHARRIEHHQHRALSERTCAIDQSCDFFHGEDRRQPTRDLRVRNVIEEIGPLERLHEEEPQRRSSSMAGE
jgi:hypothetical protein